MRLPFGRFTVGRMMVAVAASAGVSALLAACGVPAIPGFAYGSAGCLAIAGVILLAGDHRDLCSALAAVTAGLLVGAPLVQDSCSPIGLFLGPVAGIIVRLATRRRPMKPPVAPKSVSIPGVDDGRSGPSGNMADPRGDRYNGSIRPAGRAEMDERIPAP